MNSMNQQIPFVDNSQLGAFRKCPWNWHEITINKRVRRRELRQRDDALAIGSLVHAGLENWYRAGDPTIPENVIEKIGPTPEAYNQCCQLVLGYVQTYPREPWEMVRCERPLRFPLLDGHFCIPCNLQQTPDCRGNCSWCGRCEWEDRPVCDGLAKLDLYFYIPEDLEIETGLMGYPTTLAQGWWIQEYKTKGQSVDTPTWIKAWENNLQADFQMLALGHYLETRMMEIAVERGLGSREMLQLPESAHVQGVLVSVLERPAIYVPKRTCKGCRQVQPFASYLPTGTGKYRCQGCGNEQPMEPLRESVPKVPNYFRVIVTRTSEQLTAHKVEIANTARQMMLMREQGMEAAAPARTSCVDLGRKYGVVCPYLDVHIVNAIGEKGSTIDNQEFEEAEDYVNEESVD